MDKVLWKDIPGFVGYQASSTGQIRSIDRIVMKRIASNGQYLPHKRKGKVLKPEVVKSGYQRVDLVKSRAQVHSLVLLAFVGPPKSGQICRHLNGVPSDNRPVNLAWGTSQENEQDKIRHGTKVFGERHGKSILTELAVIEIAKLLHDGQKKKKEIAALYGVSQYAIYSISIGKTWRHLTSLPLA